jgi:predicted nucleotidyltransferase
VSTRWPARTSDLMRGQDIPSLDELIRARCLPEHRVAVIVVGSTALGWANASSDVDVCVVTLEPWRGAPSSGLPVGLAPDVVPVARLSLRNRRLEVRYWLDRQIDQMLERIGTDPFAASAGEASPIGAVEETFLERLSTCVPVDGSAWVARRRRQLAASGFRTLLVTRSLARSDQYAEDALGQVTAGDRDSAVLSARQALGHCVDALLESRGQYGSHDAKWRARRFRQAGSVPIAFEDYWRLETMADFDARAPQEWVVRVVAFCKDMQTFIEI